MYGVRGAPYKSYCEKRMAKVCKKELQNINPKPKTLRCSEQCPINTMQHAITNARFSVTMLRDYSLSFNQDFLHNFMDVLGTMLGTILNYERDRYARCYE